MTIETTIEYETKYEDKNISRFVSCISGGKFQASDSCDREAFDSEGVSERVIGSDESGRE